MVLFSDSFIFFGTLRSDFLLELFLSLKKNLTKIIMKKRVLYLAGLLCFFSYVASAQFKKGDKLLNLGIGVNSYYSGGIPFSSSFEVGVTDQISAGVGLDYLTHNYKIGPTNYGFSALYIGARGSYHFNELLK